MTIKHPDYDIDFKPAIARFDWDQTYDVLEFVYLPQGFDQLMGLCGIPCFELMAIDRFTPYRYRWADQYSDEVYEFLKNFNFSPHNSIIERFLRDEANQFIFNLSGHPRWENEWVSANSYAIEDVVTYNGTFYQCTTANSDTNFTTSKWKLLTYRNYSWSDTRLRKFDYIFYWDIISDISAYYVAITDNAYLKPPIEGDVKNTSEWIEISLTVPKFELKNTQVYNYEPILANFTEGKYQITGLIYQGSQEGLTGSIPTINQTFAEFTLAESTEIDINQILWNRWLKDDYFPDNNTNRFCSNSLVISKLSNGNWVDYTPSFTDKPTWLLYSDINTYFNNVKQQLINYFQNVHDGFIDYFDSRSRYAKPIDVLPLQNYFDVSLNINATLIPRDTTVYNAITKVVIPYDRVEKGFEKVYKRMNFDSLDRSTTIEHEFTINYHKFPDYMLNDCYLSRANNDKWSSQTSYIDKGKSNKFNLKQNQNKFNIINDLFPIIEDETEFLLADNLSFKFTYAQNPIKLGILSTDLICQYDLTTLDDPTLILATFYFHHSSFPPKTYYTNYASKWGSCSMGFINSKYRNFPFYAKQIISEDIQPFITWADKFTKDYTEGTWSGFNWGEVGSWNKNTHPTSGTNTTEYETFVYKAKVTQRKQFIANPNGSGVIAEYIPINQELTILDTSYGSIVESWKRPLSYNGIDFHIPPVETTNVNYQDMNPIIFDETIKSELVLFTEQEWQELYEYEAMTDQEYLDYLLQLKEQKENQ